jgi:hypothetical protein
VTHLRWRAARHAPHELSEQRFPDLLLPMPQDAVRYFVTEHSGDPVVV